MKSLYRNAQLALLLLAVFSLLILSACNNATMTESSNTKKGPVDEPNPPAKVETEAPPGKPKKAPLAVPPAMLESEMKALGGKTFKFSEYNGKVVVVNLWATWCGYCRKEMPDLVELNEQYKDQGLEIIGLNVDDETPEEVEAFVREYDVPYQIGWITDEVYSILKPRGIPSTYIITRDGNFHWGVNGAVPKARLQTKIEEALAIQN